MKKMKLRACPWCGWFSTTLVILDGTSVKKPTEYYIRCNHCGFSSRKSRFKWHTKWSWNHMNNPIAPTKKERRYHIYGREF